MNDLSFLIYLIALGQNIGYWLPIVTGFAGSLVVISFIVLSISKLVIVNVANTGDTDAKSWMEHSVTYVLKVFRIALAVWIGTVLVRMVIPEHQYLIMIAASEVGEHVIQTETAQNAIKDVTGLSSEATDLLREYIQLETVKIREQLEELKAKQNKESTK